MNEFFRTPRLAFFLVALMLLGLAFPLPAPMLVGNYPFSARMAQHLLLQLVIPALILLSLPSSTPETLKKFPAWQPISWVLSKPIITWIIGLGAMWVWHAPTLCNAAARNPFLHDFQSLSLLIVGAVFWWPVAGPGAAQRLSPLLGIIYLFTACLGCTVLGIIITFAPPGIYLSPSLPGAFSDWQFASPSDQRAGGLLMWVPGCLVYVCGILGLLARWYGAAETQTIPAHATERMS